VNKCVNFVELVEEFVLYVSIAKDQDLLWDLRINSKIFSVPVTPEYDGHWLVASSASKSTHFNLEISKAFWDKAANQIPPISK